MSELEKKIPQTKQKRVYYKHKADDWTLDEIRDVLFNKNTSKDNIEKWNSTDWGAPPVYLRDLSVDELKELEKMLID